MPKKNIDPKIWGADAWKFLLNIAEAYPNDPTFEDKMNYKNFFELIRFTLPCDKCCANYAEKLNKYPLNDMVLSNSSNLFNWVSTIKRETDSHKNKQIIHPSQGHTSKNQTRKKKKHTAVYDSKLRCKICGKIH